MGFKVKMDLKRQSQKYSKVSLIFISLLVLSAPFLIFLSSSSVILFDADYYHDKYVELGVYDNPIFGEVDIMSETRNLLHYLKYGKGQIESLEPDFFNQKEIDHLEDVRNLLRSGLSLRRLVFFFSIILLLLMFRSSPGKEEFNKCIGAYIILGSLLTLVILITMWISLSNFDSTFVGFHDAFFESDSWIFDEDTDNLINLFPQQFFEDIARHIISLVFIISSISLGVGLLVYHGRWLRRYYKRFITNKS